ncbi:MAG: hypothetical protein RJQ09_05030 [Cyclobacteriaceae bacterium]
MEFSIKDIATIVSIIITAIVTFFTTKHNLKDYIRDRIDEINKDLSHLKVENERLKGQITLQKQISDMLSGRVFDKIEDIEKKINKN